MPQQLKQSKFEEALRQYGFKDEAAAALASEFYVPEQET